MPRLSKAKTLEKDFSKGDLLKMAKDLSIVGRSKMTKTELASAIVVKQGRAKRNKS